MTGAGGVGYVFDQCFCLVSSSDGMEAVEYKGFLTGISASSQATEKHIRHFTHG